MRFEWLRSWDEITNPSFLIQWKEWADTDYIFPFYNPSLAMAWIETYKQEKCLVPCFLVVYEGDSPKLFWPLVFSRLCWKDGFLKVLQPVGADRFDYHDPILIGRYDSHWINEFWNYFKNETSHFCKCDRVDVGLLTEKVMGNDFLPKSKAPYINIGQYDDNESFLAGLHRQLRQELRRQPRRLKDAGDLQYNVIKKDDIQAAYQFLPEWLEHRDKRWPGMIRTRKLFEKLIEKALPEGLLHISTITLDGKNISWHLGFDKKKVLYYYAPTYRDEFSTYSPGKVHLGFMIEEAIGKRYEKIDFLRGMEDYKLLWTKDYTDLYGMQLTCPGLGSMCMRSVAYTLEKIRTIKKRFF